VVLTCRVLGSSSQAYYEWRSNPVSDRDWADATLADAALQIHADDPVFGYRFIADELASEHDITPSENRVHRGCSSHRIFSVFARRNGRRPRPGEPGHDDLVHRSVGVSAPNQLWFTDLAEHHTQSSVDARCKAERGAHSCSGG
jgi:putative transposase